MNKRELLLGLARTFDEHEGTCLLYSGGSFDSATKSILGLFPTERVEVKNSSHPWEKLKQDLGALDAPWFGWIDYEGDAYFQKCSVIITLDHAKDEFFIRIDPNPAENEWISLLKDPAQWSKIATTPILAKQNLKQVIKPLETLEGYVAKVKKAQEYIQAGDIYQVNLSQKMVLEGSWNPYELFYLLAQSNPSPFSAYFKTPNYTIVSTSPERLLQKKGRILETRPIKGTAPRGSNPHEDKLKKAALLNSPKELAELLMITDLMRNDLARVSIPGTVQVAKLWHCEEYANVFHLLSIITSESKSSLHPCDLLQSCFPGGSITGCPKKRAMEVIRELEQAPRGLYTGSIGYIDGNDFDFNIAIRTIEIQGNRLSFQLGGGIVADSNPYDEYHETLHKGRSFFNALDL